MKATKRNIEGAKVPFAPQRIICDITVGFRKNMSADAHLDRTSEMLKKIFYSIGSIYSFELTANEQATRFHNTVSSNSEYRYHIELDAEDVWSLVNDLARVLPACQNILGNIVLRVNDGVHVIVIPCRKQSRQIREYCKQVVEPLLITLDESIEVYRISDTGTRRNVTEMQSRHHLD